MSSTGNQRAKITLKVIKKSNKEDVSRDISCRSLQEVALVETYMNEINFIDSTYPDILSRVKQLPGKLYSNWFWVEGGNRGFIILPNFDLSNSQMNTLPKYVPEKTGRDSSAFISSLQYQFV